MPDRDNRKYHRPGNRISNIPSRLREGNPEFFHTVARRARLGPNRYLEHKLACK